MLHKNSALRILSSASSRGKNSTSRRYRDVYELTELKPLNCPSEAGGGRSRCARSMRR